MVYRIHKYSITIAKDQKVELPDGAQILHVGEDSNENLCIWALVDDRHGMVTHRIDVYATGAEIEGGRGAYEGTAVMKNGYVWHVFDLGVIRL